jgi:biotin-(acetyl-CoA carboxylase) ligase
MIFVVNPINPSSSSSSAIRIFRSSSSLLPLLFKSIINTNTSIYFTTTNTATSTTKTKTRQASFFQFQVFHYGNYYPMLSVGNRNNSNKGSSNTIISLSSLASPSLTPSLLVSTSSTCWSVLIFLLLSGSSGLGRGGTGRITYTTSSSSILFANALLLRPVMATSSSSSSSSSSHDETTTNTNTCDENNQICTNNENQNENNDTNNIQQIIGKHHPEDDQLLLYHYESTPSTQDEAKIIAKQLSSQSSSSSESHPPLPRTFCVTTAIQSNGKGTTGRKWLGTPGNVFVTIGIPVNVLMIDMMQNRNIPLTLLPLKIGDLTASLINNTLYSQQQQQQQQQSESESKQQRIVTVKWPNDVLVDGKKISGTLIESSDDWFLIGIGINVAYAPPISKTGTDYGRPSVCINEYRNKNSINNQEQQQQEDIDVARDMGVQLALDFHRWIYDSNDNAESIVEGWKKWLDYDMELVMRNDKNPPLDEIDNGNGNGNNNQQQKQKQEQEQKQRVVKIVDVLHDGRIRVQNQDEFGRMEVLVSDYFV